MAENKGDQTLSPTTKSAEDIRPSEARKQAEKPGGSGSAQKSGSEENNPNRAHPSQGRSLGYVTGPGAEAYEDGMYLSDRANDEEHFRR